MEMAGEQQEIENFRTLSQISPGSIGQVRRTLLETAAPTTLDSRPKSGLRLEFGVVLTRPDDSLFSISRGVALADGAANGPMYVSAIGAKETVAINEPKVDEMHTVALDLDLESPDSPFRILDTEPGVVYVHPNARLFAAISVLRLGALGFSAYHTAGEGTSALYPMLQQKDGRNGGAVGLSYSDGNALFAALGIHNPVLINATDRTAYTLKTMHDPDHPLNDQNTELATKALVKYATLSAQTRDQDAVYTHMPGLIKPYVELRGAYDTLPGLLNRKIGLAPATVEAFLNAGLHAELQRVGVYDFVRRNLTPPEVTPETIGRINSDAHIASQAIHRFVRSWYSYHTDNAYIRTGTGVTSMDMEHWASHSKFNPHADGDCDDSATDGTRACMDPIGIFPGNPSRVVDPEVHPVTISIRNALRHHMVGLSVIGARGAKGTDVKHSQVSINSEEVDGTAARAGHAVVILIPIEHFARALHSGMEIMRSASSKPKPSLDQIRALLDYTHGTGDIEAESLRAYMIDGTVTRSTELEPPGDLAEHKKYTHELDCARNKLGPVLADVTQELRAKNGLLDAFWAEGLQVSIGMEERLLPLGISADFAIIAHSMRDRRVGVKGKPATARPAGGSVVDMALGRYALLPHTAVDEEMATGLRILHRHAFVNAPPPVREGPTEIPAEMAKCYTESVNTLLELHSELSKKQLENKAVVGQRGVYHLELNIPPRVLVGNPNSLLQTTREILAKSVGGQVDIYPVTGLLQGPDGKEAGAHAVITAAFKCE